MKSAQLILVNEQGEQTGTASWSDAHASPGTLHRAFSIYLFRKNRTETLIQKRSAKKPLFAGVWANSCCSHPRGGEELMDAAHRRLQEELGTDLDLTPASTFIYRADDPGGNGSEHEHVTVITGNCEDDVTLSPNPDEVGDCKWVAIDQLREDMREKPEKYAPWFHQGLPLALYVAS